MANAKHRDNCKRINLKRKVYSKGKQNFKRFKRTPKFIRDNPENQIARQKEKDVYTFSDDEDDGDDLGMGIDISDLPFLDDNHDDKQKELIALTQDSVAPLFNNDSAYDESKLEEGLAELRHTSFRPGQKEAIKRILYGRSTLFISPTGSGKSLCYQLPALLYWRYRKYMTIVVSPLISLMEDQMSNFPTSLKAVSLHSGHNAMQRRRSIEQLVNHEAQVVFISPEAIVGGLLDLDDLKNLPPVGFVCIDEAHCLSEWSHNFRPAYMQFFKILHEQMNIKTFLGITATATRATSFAIARHLVINPDTDVIGATTIPDNLILSVSYESNKEAALIKLLKSPTFRIMTSIIIYCNRREETEKVATSIRTAMQNYSSLVEIPERKKGTEIATAKDDSLISNGSNSSLSDRPHMKLTWNAEAYHAGLTTDTRKRIQRLFIKGEIRVVVATIAFGMGINKANVRAIIHYDMPSSFESYVQEIGRAGRDGKPAQCHMFLKADKTDLFYQQRNIYSCTTEPKNLEKLTDYLFKTHTCRCSKLATEEDNNKYDKLNQLDPHEISSLHQTNFTGVAANTSNVDSGLGEQVDEEDEDDDDDVLDLFTNDENKSEERIEKPIKYKRKSLVRKHRPCKGHEISIPVEQASNELNLRPESIVTLICQLQKVYPQLQIQQYTPAKSTCNLMCYHGPSQMEQLSLKSQPVKTALFMYRVEHLKSFGTKPETPSKFSFDYIKVASMLGIPSSDVMRMLKKTEWELVDKTGRFKRSQVRVGFEGNSFHLKSIGDLTKEELHEIHEFLCDFSRLYEIIEREKVARVYNTMKKHCIKLDVMMDKEARLETSAKLKGALDAYFASSAEHQVVPVITEVQLINNSSINSDSFDESAKLSNVKEDSIKKDARAFISAHGRDYTPRAIAKIFQGISTPNYPAEHWGMNRKWWRIHPDVDFLKLTSIITEMLL